MSEVFIRETLAPLVYLVSATVFILGLKRLSRVRTARHGNGLAALAMLLAVLGTLLELGWVDVRWILSGLVVGTAVGMVAALRVPMTAMPEMVAVFNGFGGAASALVGLAVFWLGVVEADAIGTVASTLGPSNAVTIALSVFVGALTFTGSLIAFAKLNGSLVKGQPILLPARHAINGLLSIAALLSMALFGFLADTPTDSATAVFILTGLSALLGVLVVIPIGGADMPVVVSLLNSYSGLAASAAGFVIGNPLLIIAGAMVGAAGLILTQIMCVAMNRSLVSVLVGGFGMTAAGSATGSSEYTSVKSTSAEEAAMVLESAESVIFVPGYGLAVAQAQHTVKELADLLHARGANVQYAIHPVAGRMPGHMNVLLAEADVPYEQLVEMDVINPAFRNTDVVIVVGANDVVNPGAAEDPSSPIYGMPILQVQHARTVFVIKRSLGAGYAGIKNTLFERDNTMMIFQDARKALQDLVAELKAQSR